MTIDEKDRQIRRQGIGSSDIQAIASPVPVRGAKHSIDVYLEKVGLLDEFGGNDTTDLGNYLEPWIGRKYSELLGVSLRSARTRVHPSHSWVLGSPDYLWEDGRRGLECKHVGQHMAKFWANEEDGYPEHVLVQCTWLMTVHEMDHWDIAALIGGRPPIRIYHLDYDLELANLLLELGKDFWFKHVLAKRPPAYDATVSSRVVEALYPINNGSLRPATTKEVELCRTREHLKKQMLTLKDQIAAVDDSIKTSIGDHDGFRWDDGYATWKKKRSNGTDWKRLALDLGADAGSIARYEIEGSRLLRVKLGEDEGENE